MPSEIKIPAVGESITEVQISEWLKSEGDSVKQDEPIAVIDSEKTTFDLPAPQAGKLVKILHKAGETVAVGTAVAQLEAEGEAGKSESEKKETASKSETKVADKSKTKTEKPEPAEESKIAEKPAKEIDGEKSKEEKSEVVESQKESAKDERK